MKNNVIGILGGMGPQASIELNRMLIEKSVQNYGAKDNDSFPDILINSIPVPDFISNETHKEKALKILKVRVKRMDAFGVGTLCIACNTAHILLPDLQKITSTPFISIIDEVHKIVIGKKYKKVGLLATITTYKSKLYENKLTECQVIKPKKSMQQLFDRSIRNVIGGKDRLKIQQKIAPVIYSFIKENSLEAIILGCTEIPLIVPSDLPVPVINSLDVLAEALLKHYYQ